MLSLVELRQLRYFVAVAQELHFGRAAAQLHIAAPSLSAQIKVLERDLGTLLFLRDRRGVALTAAGQQLLGDAREMLALADRSRRNLEGKRAQLRLGYVSWLPAQLRHLSSVDVRVDEWVMPSHAQVERVRHGSLDAAIAWTPTQPRDLELQLLRYEPLSGVARRGHQCIEVGCIPSAQVTALVDTDQTSWGSWNAFALALAADTGAEVVETFDGGLTGSGFHDHCERLRRPVLSSPKRHESSLPAGLRLLPVNAPTPIWSWSLITRAADERPEVRALRRSAAELSESSGWAALPPDPWVPPGSPYPSPPPG